MKEYLAEFYVRNFKSVEATPDISFVPPIQRRRMSRLDKIALAAMYETYSADIQNIVFSSTFGQTDRLFKLIDEYTKEKETSPMTFASSVHNSPVSTFLLTIQKSIPYTALSSNQNGFISGLIAARVSPCDNVLYCNCDVFEDTFYAISLNICKLPDKNLKKYRIIENTEEKNAQPREIIKFFSSENDELITKGYTIKRIDL